MNNCFKACIMPNKLRLLQISKLFWGAQVGLFHQSILHKIWSKIHNCGAHFSVGKIIYLVGNFGQWAGLINWVGKTIYKVGKCPPSLPLIYLPAFNQTLVILKECIQNYEPVISYFFYHYKTNYFTMEINATQELQKTCELQKGSLNFTGSKLCNYLDNY